MRLLIVEDEENLREILKKRLKGEHYSVDSCGDGIEAMEYMDMVEYDGIILDIMLPGMNGLELLSKLKASPKNRDIPVIMLTAKGAEYDKVKALDAGADDYVTKPFGMMELVSRIKAVLRRSRKTGDDRVRENVLSFEEHRKIYRIHRTSLFLVTLR